MLERSKLALRILPVSIDLILGLVDYTGTIVTVRSRADVGGPGPAHLSVELLVRVLDVIGNREIRMPSWQCPEGAHVHEGREIFLEAGADREHDPGRASSKERSVLRIGVVKVQLVGLLLRLVPEVRVQQVVHVLPLDRLMDELDE